MALALEIAFAAAICVVALSFLAVVLGKASDRLLLLVTIALAVGSAVAVIALGIDLADSYTDVDALLLAAGGFAAAAVAEAGLLALNRGLRRMQETERLADAARDEIHTFASEESQQRILELERILARERANTSHQLSEQERRLAEERRDTVERQAVTAYEARLAADAEHVDAASEEQRLAVAKLREELQRFGTSFLEDGRSEIEIHAAERRRALHEVSERLRSRERAMREQLERDETEAKGRIATGLEESERRHLAALDRAFERAATRLTEYAEKQFDAQIKESREKAADRLSRELDKAIEQFARQAEKDVADRIADMARMTADRLQRRINDVARSAEAEHNAAAERVRHLSSRLEESLAAAEERQAALEADLDASMRSLDRD